MAAPDPEREHRLIEQLELRIASADSSEKFGSLIQKFLPALVLKLASESVSNRNLAIKVCQYVNQRLKIDESIQLPVGGLSKTFGETQNAFVKQFCLLFIQQGLVRMPPTDSIQTLPEVLRSGIKTTKHDRSDEKMSWIAFSFLLDVLRVWKIPEHNSKEDLVLKETFALSEQQVKIIVSHLVSFLLYDPRSSPTTSLGDEDAAIYNKNFAARSGVVPNIAKFLFTSIFTDDQRVVPAPILSVDATSEASTRADIMFKQCNFDLEDDDTVKALFELYDNSKPRLQTRILSLLSRSQKSTEDPSKTLRMVEAALAEDSSGLEGTKLRTAVFNYLTWATRISPNLGSVATEIQESLKEYIELQGWPIATQPSSYQADLRSKAYESIGLLASSKNYDRSEASQPTYDFVLWLFTSLRCDTTPNARHSVEEALSRVMNTIELTDDEDSRKLKDLLLWNVLSEADEEDPIYHFPTRISAKYPAVRFANKCFPFSDVDARFIDLIAMNSERREISDEGCRGLDPYWHASNAKIGGRTKSSTSSPPDLHQFFQRTFKHATADAKEIEALRQPTTLSGAVIFARNLIALNAWQGTEFAVEADQDWKLRVDALLDNDAKARDLIRAYLGRIGTETTKLLLERSFEGLTLGSQVCVELALQLTSLSSNECLRCLDPAVLTAVSNAVIKSGVQYQACRIFGILASLTDSWEMQVNTALSHCNQWSTAVGQQIVVMRGHLMKAIYTISRRSLRTPSQITMDHTRPLWQILSAIVQKGTDKSLRETAFDGFTRLGLCLRPDATVDLKLDELFDTLLKDAKQENEGAVSAIGSLLCLGFPQMKDQEKDHVLNKLFELHEVRKAEFHFALGRAFAVSSLGFKSSSTMTSFDVDAPSPGWGFSEDLFARLLDRALSDCKTTKPSLKKAAGIWLLSLIQFCEDTDLVKPRLRSCQAAFATLLTDRDEVVQETGSRGLGIVYEKGDPALRDDLVRDLVQSFTSSNAKMSGTVNEDTQLFEPGALPTEHGQSVTTYKDIVSLAQEMGDPSLVYRFMNLASNNAIWTSRAAFGRFGLSGVLADSSYLSENQKFYPKLFRYRFDPNPNVQRSMDDIWKALVKDSNAVIDENFDMIMEDLLKSIVLGKEWRAREASCSAIADLVQGRDLEKFEKYLDEIWKVAFKVLDDVKETVRVAAMKLCRTLTAMLIRNLEVGEGNTRRANTMLEHAMPFLLQQMEGGSAKEVQQYAIVTLLDIAKKAPTQSLRRFAPTILETLINSLSSLEHESINYLHLNADKYGLTAEKLDKMRVSSVSTSPVSEAIERCLESLAVTGEAANANAMVGVEYQPLEDAMRRLENTFKTTIGLPSKVGLSRVMVSLVIRHQIMFKPYADRFVRLVRKSLLDRNATVSVSFSTALAYLLRLSSEKEIRETNQYAQKLYFESQELSHRAVAGEIVQSLGKVSTDVFMKFATLFLPFAFIGRQDLEADVRDRFDLAWKENVGGSRALNLYLTEITQLLSIHIKSSLWPIRHACCFAVADLISSIEASHHYTVAEAKLLWPLMEEALSGKTWDGKQKVISAFPKFVKKASTLWPEQMEQMTKIALREAKRTNTSYRPHAISALGEFALARPGVDLSGQIVPILTALFDELLDPNAMEVDDKTGLGSDSSKLLDDNLNSAIKCLFASLQPGSRAEVLEPSTELLQRAYKQHPSVIAMAVYESAQQLLEKETQNVKVKSAENKTEQSAIEKDAPGKVSMAYERFWERFVTVCLAADPERHAEAIESLRWARVRTSHSLAQSGIPNQTTRGTLATVFDVWLQTERSRPLRQNIEQAAQVNSLRPGGSGNRPV